MKQDKNQREYSEQFYTHKFDNFYKINQFLKRHKVSQVSKNESDHLNSPITIKKIKFISLKLQKQTKKELTRL